MADWTISVVQVPIAVGFRHNSIVIRDGDGNFYREINGGPVDPTGGRLIDLGSSAFQAGTAYLTGSNDVGVEISSTPKYTAGLGPGTQVFSGTEEQVKARDVKMRTVDANARPIVRLLNSAELASEKGSMQ